MAANNDERPHNIVRVGSRGTKFLYVDLTKHLLHDGEAEVIISALNKAINEAVSVAEMLKDQGMIIVRNIRTTREVNEENRNPADKIEIVVTKAKDFDTKYAEQQKLREEKKAERANAN